MLHGEIHATTLSAHNRTTLGAVEQKISSENNTDKSHNEPNQFENEIESEIIQRTKAMKQDVKYIEKELRSLSGDSGIVSICSNSSNEDNYTDTSSPCSNNSSKGSWIDKFGDPSHGVIPKLYDRINTLHMQIESFHSKVRTGALCPELSTCSHQGSDVDYGMFFILFLPLIFEDPQINSVLYYMFIRSIISPYTTVLNPSACTGTAQLSGY